MKLKINFKDKNQIQNEEDNIKVPMPKEEDLLLEAQDKKEKKRFLGRLSKIEPESLENALKQWFNSNKIFSLFISFVVGIITHITFLTEMILSQDGMWNSLGHIMPTDWEICLGRWGIAISDYLVNNLSMPNITGVVSLILIALSTLFIIDVVNIKSKFSVFLISIAMMVSPALTSTLIYVYTSVAYCIALLTSTIAVRLMFTKKCKILSRLLSVALVCFTLSIYQSYLGFIVGLALIALISKLFEEDAKLLNIFIKGIVIVLIVILGGLLYMKVTNNILEKMNLNLADYNGASSISIEKSLNNLNKTIPNSYNDFYRYYFTDEMVTNSNFNRINLWKYAFISSLILGIFSILVNKMWKKPWKILFLIAFTILVPLALSSVDLLVVDYALYILTAAQFNLVVVLMMVFFEATQNRFLFIFRYASIAITFVVLYTYFLADTASYSAMKLTYNQAIAVTNRILTRIEMEESYSIDKPVLIAGYILDDSLEFSKRSDIYEYTIHPFFNSPAIHGAYYGMQGTWMKFINIYLGTRVVYCSTQDYTNIVNSDDFKEMAIYPAQNSIKNINGVMVVKLREDPPMP